MSSTVSVGQFATMTHLSVKTLRHYHEVGLLEPARVDEWTSYRYYSLDQLPAAQLIRRLRDLKMPIPEVRSVLLASDPNERSALISAHMERLEAELAETRAAVNSLRVLLDTARTRAPIACRHVPAFTAISICDTIDPDDVAIWWASALAELRAYALDHDLRLTGPAGGVFDEALYQQERAKAMVYLPFSGLADDSGRIRSVHIPEADVVITTHYGSAADIDLAYADLGSYLAAHDIAVAKQIREHYLCDQSDTPDEARWQTEIAWPILTD
jgi:DNA-binding transcriptional MerR regulator/effector-binding domain-containing protein